MLKYINMAKNATAFGGVPQKAGENYEKEQKEKRQRIFKRIEKSNQAWDTLGNFFCFSNIFFNVRA